MKELTGKGNPFHSALDKAASLLKRNVGTGMEFMQELGKIPGVKKEEIEDRKLHEIMGMPKMTREKFLSELQNRPVPQIHEKELGINQKALNEHARELAYKDARDFLRQEGWRGDALDDMADDMADENASQFIAEAHDELVNKYKHEFPWHEQHTLPGGENYREMLIKAPGGRAPKPEKIIFKSQDDVDDFLTDMSASGFEGMDYGRLDKENAIEFERGVPNSVLGFIESNNGRLEKPREDASNEFEGVGTHFGGEPGILASMRVKDRTGPNGEKLLHLEELQSDWHQKGREGGYGSQLTPEDAKRIEQLRQISANSGMSMDERAEFDSLIKKREGAVPDAPFKKNWEEMALKRLIHHAAENGYHGIVVTPGAEQADRYDLAKHVNRIAYNPNSGYLFVTDKNGQTLTGLPKNVSPEQLEGLIGKDATKKLLETKPSSVGIHQLEGEGLTVGGEGMKGFYDKKVPNILNSVGKKYGVKTQLHGQTVGAEPEWKLSRSEDNKLIKEQVPRQWAVHHFPITEEMRKDVLQNGLPLYAEGGEVHMADGGSIGENGDAPIPSPKQGVKVNPSIAQMKLALATKGNPLSVQSIGANEAPSMSPKTYLPPDTQQGQYVPPGGAATPSGMPVGGIDMNSMQPGNQLMPGGLQPPQPQQPQQGPQAGPQQAPQPGQPQQPQGGGNILQMTPQGRAMAAISPNPPQGMADGGSMHEKTSRLKQMLEQKFSPQAIKASEALGQHEGKTLHVTQSDRTKVGGGFLGGPGFSSLQHVDPDYANLVWGVNSPGAASRIINVSSEHPEGKALWSTMIGAPTQHSSNQMVFSMLLKEFKKGIKAGKLKPETRAAINQILATSVDSQGNPIFGNRVDISGKNFFENLNTFDKRRVMADLMGGVRVGGKKGQVFDYDKIIQQTTEPELLGAPTHAIGPRLFTATGERSYRPDLHPAFPHMVHGEDLGVMYHPVPKEVMLPEFHEKIKKEKGRNVGYMDLTRNMPSQFLSENFLTQLQKRGYKKGGNVNQDTMLLELAKSKKAK